MSFAEELKEKTAKTLDARLEVIKAMRKEIAEINSYGPEFHKWNVDLLTLSTLFVSHGLISKEDRDLNVSMYHFNKALETVKQYFENEGIKVKVKFSYRIEFEFDWGTE